MAVETATNFTKDFICWATNMVTLLSSKCSSAFFNALNSLYLTPYFSMTVNRHWNQRLLDETFNRRYKFKQYFRWQIRQTKSLNSITSITSKEGTSPTVLLHFSHVLTLFFLWQPCNTFVLPDQSCLPNTLWIQRYCCQRPTWIMRGWDQNKLLVVKTLPMRNSLN